jgi:hypothetical protein
MHARALALVTLLTCGACVTGGPRPETVFASGQAGPAWLCFDGAWLYWANTGAGEVLRLPLDGGMADALASGQDQPTALALGEAELFWNNLGSRAIIRVSLDGGAPTAVLEDAGRPLNMVVAGGALFFGGDGLVTLPLDGGPVGEAGLPGSVQYVAADATHLLWSLYGGEIRRVPLAGGPEELVAPGPNDLTSLIVGPTHIYLATFGGKIGRVPLDGGPVELLSTSERFARGLALDGDVLYWAAGPEGAADGLIRRLRPGGSPETFAAGQGKPDSIVVAGDGVYWIDAQAGTVLRAPR